MQLITQLIGNHHRHPPCNILYLSDAIVAQMMRGGERFEMQGIKEDMTFRCDALRKCVAPEGRQPYTTGRGYSPSILHTWGTAAGQLTAMMCRPRTPSISRTWLATSQQMSRPAFC